MFWKLKIKIELEMKLIKLFFFFLFAICFTSSCFANSPIWQNEKLNIFIYTKNIDENKSNILIELELKDGWFISWDNPGDAGIPTTFTWNKLIKRVNQSTPQIVLYENILGQYGYSDKAFYLFEGHKTDSSLNVKINWEACKNECEKESADINFTLSEAQVSLYDTKYAEAISTFPSKTIINAKTDINYDKQTAILNIHIDNFSDLSDFSELYFIPYQKSIINVAEKQNIYKSKNKVILQVPLNKPVIPFQGGLLVNKDKSYKISFTPLNDNPDLSNMLYILILSFIGGILLNFMPCVFPVLSLKAMAASNDKKDIKKALLYFTGVMTSFLTLASILFLLRKGGNAIGWGFQLQSTAFVIIMLLIFVVLFLMILDIITISPILLNWFNKMGGINSFMSGFFAVLIASPCTGPFLGAALGFTLMQSPYVYFMIFLSLGTGYALPFTLLELYPKVLSKIFPKSGKWTRKVKYILSIPILFTCIWLMWILFYQFKNNNCDINETHFKNYDEVQIRELINMKKPVFIEFTAKWCLTCLLNEKNVLNNKSFILLAKQKNISLFRADWTHSDEKIGQAIKTYGRNSVPLYVYYSPEQQNYVILPQLLTLDIVKSVFDSKYKNQN